MMSARGDLAVSDIRDKFYQVRRPIKIEHGSGLIFSYPKAGSRMPRFLVTN